MDHKYIGETNTIKFSTEELNDSDYIKLARDYRNNESGKVLMELFSLIQQALTLKIKSVRARLPFNFRAV